MDFTTHLDRLRSAVNNTFDIYNTADWIEKHTYINGKRYSFKGYEYQKAILADLSRVTLTIKPAQVGVSELSYRYAVALCCTQDDFTTLYTFPSSSDAEKNCRTRIDPMIQGSPEVRRLVNPEFNNSEIKQFSRNSFLMFKGTRSATQALSTPANCLIQDEFDASDITQASVYLSRLQNRPHKLRKLFSTPTVDGYGISKEAETAKRFRHIAKCDHCNHKFLPDYFRDVKVPGWDKPLEEISRSNIHELQWRKAVLLCPNCGRDPNLHHSRMEFVCENPSENYEAHAYYISPFSVPTIITPDYLVNTSTKYERFSEFKNQALGLTGEEKDESILASDIDTATIHTDLHSSELTVMGGDMGIVCNIVVARMATDGTFMVIHREQIHYTNFEARTLELTVKYRVVLTVLDSQPYTDLVTRLSRSRPHTWGCIFVNTKSPQAFTLEQAEEDTTLGKMALKLVKANRTRALDSLLAVIKSGKWVIQSSDIDDLYKTHMLSMKRIQKFTSDGELTYVWDKTNGEDHMMFATLYAYIATQMRGTVGGTGAISSGMGLAFRTKGPQYGVQGNH